MLSFDNSTVFESYNYYNRQGKLTKMTPREFFRTMGFDDDLNVVVSDSQAYKQAGNSIVVNVLEGIIKQIVNYKQNKKNSNKNNLKLYAQLYEDAYAN